MLQMSTHFPTAAILPAMLPTVASSTLPGLPIIQASQIPAGIGNTPGLGSFFFAQINQATFECKFHHGLMI